MVKKEIVPGLFAPKKGYGAPVHGSDKEHSSKRRLKDINGRVPLPILYEKLVNSEGWPYRRDKEKYQCRDRSLISAIILTGGRINEVLTLKKDQILDVPDAPNFKMISNFPVSKRKDGNAEAGIFLDYRSEVAIPLEGAPGLWAELVPFSNLFLEYIDLVKTGRIYKVTDTRTWQIVDATLGVWNHYLRAVAESHLIRIMKDSVIVGRYMKVNPETLAKYVQADWRDFTQ